MKKLKTLFKFVKKLDFKNMFKIVKKLSKKSGKFRIVILFDIIYSGFVYGAGYHDYQEFEFYLLNKKERKTYLTRVKNNEIVKKYNQKDSFYKFDDKATFNELFKDYIKRDYLLLTDKNYEEFEKFVTKHQRIIVKPVDGVGGHGIEMHEINSKTNLIKLYDELLLNKQILIEEYIIQHRDIANLYEKSVNTLRLFTFYDGKISSVLNPVFKVGNGGVTDNFSSGSMYTFTDDNGKVIVPAIDLEDNIYDVHPLSKKPIVGFQIPYFKEACDLVKEAAKVVPEVKYIGWDVAITPKGPVIIEGNSFPGVFQTKPSLSNKKEGLIPKYRKVMEID